MLFKKPALIDSLKPFLDEKVALYNNPSFIEDDPIQIPHLFSKKQDIEIAGFFSATLAWGLRKTIIRKCRELLEMMDWAPHDFILNHSEAELTPLAGFKHRTFNSTDLLYFIEWFRWFYSKHESLEEAFTATMPLHAEDTRAALEGFHKMFFSLPESPKRTEKHVPTPLRNSTCKRLNMYLRWMVRKDNRGVDFGLWNKIEMSQLLCPLDLHVDRIARSLGLLERKQTDWRATIELTENLRKLDPNDPVKYDFALFGMGVTEGKDEIQ